MKAEGRVEHKDFEETIASQTKANLGETEKKGETGRCN